MADITGYSPAQAQQDINNFTEAYQAADIILQNAMGDFVDELSTKWYSPKAVEFWHFYVAERTNILTLINAVIASLLLPLNISNIAFALSFADTYLFL